MAKLTIKEIQKLAKKIIAAEPGGIRYSVLVARISGQHPETPKNTVHGSVWDLDKTFDGEVVKPSRGLFKLAEKNSTTARKSVSSVPLEPSIRETDFYQSFADWLRNDLDEATVAIPLGGAGLRGKWGTPDVIGMFKPIPSNRVKFDPEIISAEIKTNPNESITAFGQAAAYRLFSHKVYLVMPGTLTEEDSSRIEALALLFGIGFVIFDANPDDPKYRVRVRAQRFSPDMFYVNEFADRLHDHNRSVFNTLFQ
ncbi:MAG: hypothetical protein K2W85_12975 [Phycisphaerales bacterium]|nr:hypothetical protein [Phycisphaerales bacterium]